MEGVIVRRPWSSQVRTWSGKFAIFADSSSFVFEKSMPSSSLRISVSARVVFATRDELTDVWERAWKDVAEGDSGLGMDVFAQF